MRSEEQHAEADLLALVQLGHFDISPALLTGGGVAIDEVVSGFNPVDMHALDEVLQSVPETGWRRIQETLAVPELELGPSAVFAARHVGELDEWALITLVQRDGRWTFSADPGPLVVRPGRPARRQGLRLSWPDELLAVRSTSIPVLRVNLQNVSDRMWSAHGLDSNHVCAWLVDSEGEHLPTSRWHAFAPGNGIGSLEPGEVRSLPVTVKKPNVGKLLPGRYGLDAVLLDLGIHSEAGVASTL